jgi:hypothetical protein
MAITTLRRIPRSHARLNESVEEIDTGLGERDDESVPHGSASGLVPGRGWDAGDQGPLVSVAMDAARFATAPAGEP